mgnify:CR=1 FL=1
MAGPALEEGDANPIYTSAGLPLARELEGAKNYVPGPL